MKVVTPGGAALTGPTHYTVPIHCTVPIVGRANAVPPGDYLD